MLVNRASLRPSGCLCACREHGSHPNIKFTIDEANSEQYGTAASSKARKPDSWPPNPWTSDVLEGLGIVVTEPRTLDDQLQFFKKLPEWEDVNESKLREAAMAMCQFVCMGVSVDKVRCSYLHADLAHVLDFAVGKRCKVEIIRYSSLAPRTCS